MKKQKKKFSKCTKSYLSPIRENLSISSVSYKFLWKLSHARVKIIQNHMYNGGCMSRPSRDLIYGICSVIDKILLQLTGSRRCPKIFILPIIDEQTNFPFQSIHIIYKEVKKSIGYVHYCKLLYVLQEVVWSSLS